jgi:hypothetical protein
MTQFTCKGVKQINNRISLNMTFTFTIRISLHFSGVQNGEFPEILIAKCRSRFFCTWFFWRAEDFESWRKGPSKSGEKCSRRKVHMYVISKQNTKYLCIVSILLVENTKYLYIVSILSVNRTQSTSTLYQSNQ